MYKKRIINSFNKAGFEVKIPDIDYKDISISFVTVENSRENYCKIKNSPIYYYIIEGNGNFDIGDKVIVEQGELIEIPCNKKYTYSGNMKMLEIIPKSFENLEIEEEGKC